MSSTTGKVPRWTAWDERLLRERLQRIAAAKAAKEKS